MIHSSVQVHLESFLPRVTAHLFLSSLSFSTSLYSNISAALFKDVFLDITACTMEDAYCQQFPTEYVFTLLKSSFGLTPILETDTFGFRSYPSLS